MPATLNPNLPLLATLRRGADQPKDQLAEAAGVARANLARTLANQQRGGWLDDAMALTEQGEAALATVQIEGDDARRAIPAAAIDPSPFNPRKTFDDAALATLADALEAQGQLQPILLRPHPAAPERFEIVAGERRWRAAMLLTEHARQIDGLEFGHILADVRDMDDAAAFTAAISENADREDVSPIEEGAALAEAVRRGIGGAKELAAALGRPERNIQQRIAIATKLTPAGQDALRDGRITLSMARTLAHHHPDLQTHLVEDVTKKTWDAPGNESELREWIARQGPRLGAMRFDRQGYERAGGRLSGEGKAAICLDRDIALELQRGAALSMAVERAGQDQLARGGKCAPHFWQGDWPAPDKETAEKDGWQSHCDLPADTLAPFLCAIAEIDRQTMEIRIHAPRVDGAALANAGIGRHGEDEQAKTPAPNWGHSILRAGAKARRRALADALTRQAAERPHIHLALLALSFLPGAESDADDADFGEAAEMMNLYQEALTLDTSNAESMAREWAATAKRLATTLKAGAPGAGLIIKDGAPLVTDWGEALAWLAERPDTPELLAAIVSDLMANARPPASTGAASTEIALAGMLGLKTPAVGLTEHFKAYGRPELLAVAQAHMLPEGLEPTKIEDDNLLRVKLAEALQDNFTPPEVAFLPKSEISQAITHLTGETADEAEAEAAAEGLEV